MHKKKAGKKPKKVNAIFLDNQIIKIRKEKKEKKFDAKRGNLYDDSVSVEYIQY